MGDWKYYNHSFITDCSPHVLPDTSPIRDGSIWKTQKGALLARWTENFDCGTETQWWYVIKEGPFDISSLKAKRRYEINKGLRNFEIRVIDPMEYQDPLFSVQTAAFSAYPQSYRPPVDPERFYRTVGKWQAYRVFGAFSRKDGSLCGYAYLVPKGEKCWDFAVQKVCPECEKDGINAALVYGLLEDQKSFLENGGYICDGERSISHDTAFQDYLEKYFGFRKAYCSLRLAYRPGMGAVVACLYPLRSLLLKFDDHKLIHNINAVLRMESIRRTFGSENEHE